VTCAATGVLIVLAAVVAGCAAAPDAERARRPSVKPGEFGTPGCFLPRTVLDFTVLDDRNLVVFAPGRGDAYHVQVSPPSASLRFAQRLAFRSNDSRLCGYAGDSLLVADAPGYDARLSVTGVYRLDERALAGLQARFGKAPPAAAPAPQPGPGAAIERELGTGP
jgi:hypothetical protein